MLSSPNISDHDEEEHDIVAEYENHVSDEDQGNVQRDDGSGSENEQNVGRRVDPSTSRKHVVRNPLPKLNTERLKGPKGIQTIEKYFEGFKFHGTGSEKLDLDRIMKRLEHWGHRLFPKLDFDDFLDRLEKMGTKKDLQVFIKKYRLDMINDDNDIIKPGDEDLEEDKERDQDDPIDEFDLLIAEQIEKQKQVIQQTSANTSANNDAFDKLLTQSSVKSSQSINIASTSSQLSDEVKERIERNRQQAIQRRLARIKAMEEGAKKKKLDESEATQLEIVNDQSTENRKNEDDLQKTYEES